MCTKLSIGQNNCSLLHYFVTAQVQLLGRSVIMLRKMMFDDDSSVLSALLGCFSRGGGYCLLGTNAIMH